MAIDYKFYKQKTNCCVPACLQSILDSREIVVPSQEEIFSLFPSNENGVILNPENLNEFLERYNLKAEYQHKCLSFIDIEEVVKDAIQASKNILTGYYSSLVFRALHASILVDTDGDNAILLDPTNKFKTVKFNDILNSMLPLDGQVGFYLIDKIKN